MHGLLRRNLYPYRENVKEKAHMDLMRPKLEYYASVWDPSVQISASSVLGSETHGRPQVKPAHQKHISQSQSHAWSIASELVPLQRKRQGDSIYSSCETQAWIRCVDLGSIWADQFRWTWDGSTTSRSMRTRRFQTRVGCGNRAVVLTPVAVVLTPVAISRRTTCSCQTELMYNTVHRLVDINADHIIKDKTSKTCTGSDLFTFQHIAENKDIYANYSFYPRTIPEWNSLPIDVRTPSSVEQFKSKITQVDINSLLKNSHYQELVPPLLHVNIHWGVCAVSHQNQIHSTPNGIRMPLAGRFYSRSILLLF